MGRITCFLRDGDRVFLTYRTTGRGNEPAAGVFGLLDMTPYGRGEAWEDTPDGWPEGQGSCWYWRTDADGVATPGPTAGPRRSGPVPTQAPASGTARRRLTDQSSTGWASAGIGPNTSVRSRAGAGWRRQVGPDDAVEAEPATGPPPAAPRHQVPGPAGVGEAHRLDRPAAGLGAGGVGVVDHHDDLAGDGLLEHLRRPGRRPSAPDRAASTPARRSSPPPTPRRAPSPPAPWPAPGDPRRRTARRPAPTSAWRWRWPRPT